MCTPGVTVFVIADPKTLSEGVCTRCGNWRPGWGAGYKGEACVRMQNDGGEVWCEICTRCKGTGLEPKKRWYNPRTW